MWAPTISPPPSRPPALRPATTSETKPAVSPVMRARLTRLIGKRITSISPWASRACASVNPTRATSGSRKG